MGLFKRLQSISNRLGLIKVITADTTGDQSEQPQVQTRTISLEALSAEIRTQEVQALAEQPAEMSVSLEEVIEAAGVRAPAHGWDMQRLHGLLNTAQYRAMDRAAAQKAVLGTLKSGQVEVDDLINDAVRRDKALDAFQDFVRQKLERREQARRNEIQQIRSEIALMLEQINRSEEQSKVERAQWDQWLDKKQAAEDDLAWALGYLLEESIITRD